MGIEFFVSAAFAQNTVPFVVLPLWVNKIRVIPEVADS